ncbi:MAG: ADP-forming succinate--CoA ligase subunit beta [Planctomycetes bacterium]|nr:ADP-forming succinate--CoA ligase subunit beta [Planctomycetota bacterium]
MNIHEYQAKEVLARFGVAVPRGVVVKNRKDVDSAIEQLGGDLWVVKAQIHAGGRGKGKIVTPENARKVASVCHTGKDAVAEIEKQKLSLSKGVTVTNDRAKVKSIVETVLGNHLVTIQTGNAGKSVNAVYITEGVDLIKDPIGSQLRAGQEKDFELYIALTVDRETGKVCILASREGGVEIEVVAHEKPELLRKIWVDPCVGFQEFAGYQIASDMKLNPKQQKSFVKLIDGLYRVFTALDASIVEVNPAVVTADDDVVALDAKINFDDNALFRHPDVEEMRDSTEEDQAEQEAHKWGLSYVPLEGNVGCLVNGAGLAMATMDLILRYGEKSGISPANFLDVGGGAKEEQVKAAFSIILRDPAVKAILVNIFGGIMLCDIVARGIVAAAKDLGVKVPLVVRLEGNHQAEGKAILKDSGLHIIPADSMADAGEKVVKAALGEI